MLVQAKVCRTVSNISQHQSPFLLVAGPKLQSFCAPIFIISISIGLASGFQGLRIYFGESQITRAHLEFDSCLSAFPTLYTCTKMVLKDPTSQEVVCTVCFMDHNTSLDFNLHLAFMPVTPVIVLILKTTRML